MQNKIKLTGTPGHTNTTRACVCCSWCVPTDMTSNMICNNGVQHGASHRQGYYCAVSRVRVASGKPPGVRLRDRGRLQLGNHKWPTLQANASSSQVYNRRACRVGHIIGQVALRGTVWEFHVIARDQSRSLLENCQDCLIPLSLLLTPPPPLSWFLTYAKSNMPVQVTHPFLPRRVRNSQLLSSSKTAKTRSHKTCS